MRTTKKGLFEVDEFEDLHGPTSADGGLWTVDGTINNT